MNKAILKFKNGKTKDINTKLSDYDKIVKFLKITGDWNPQVIDIEIIENIKSASCNYQNMDE